MLLLYTSPWYLAGLAAWIAALAWLGRSLLRWRRTRRRSGRTLTLPHAMLSTWTALCLLTAAEVAFVLFVDHSDAFNLTNVSKRWFARHIDAERNGAGFRDRGEFEKSVPAGVKRIVFVGDSFTIGHGVRDMADRFSDRVAAGLESRAPGKYVVANVADPGLEISQIEARIRAIVNSGYQVDTVVYVLCLNDIEGYDPKTEEAIREVQSAQRSNPLVTRTYFLNWLYWRGVQASNRGARDYFPHLRESYDGEPWDGFSAKLLELRNDCLSSGAELRVVIFPFLTELGPGYPFHAAHEKIAAFCEANRIPCLDLAPALTKRRADGLTVSPFDAHPNERAHALAAEAMLEGLLDDFE